MSSFQAASGDAGLAAGRRLAIEQDMTIYTAAELRETLAAALEGQDALRLDLSAVAEFDSTGFQLLLAASRQARQQGKAFGLDAVSAPVRDLFALYRRTALLDELSGSQASDQGDFQ